MKLVNPNIIYILGEVVPSEILPSIDLFSHLSADNPAPLELVFLADDIPALGAKLYKVAINNKKATRSPLIQRNSVFSIGDSVSYYCEI